MVSQSMTVGLAAGRHRALNQVFAYISVFIDAFTTHS